MAELLSISPSHPYIYTLFAFTIALLVRIGISFIKAKRVSVGFWKIFKGFSEKDGHSDYWLAFILGVGEMLVYPLLIITDHALFIGAWLAFKTIHKWHYAPNQPRGLYNRYLVANGIILIAAYFSARWFAI